MSLKKQEAADRMARRRQDEDEAPRLPTLVPRLRTLRLSIEYRRSDVQPAEPSHVRVVVVSRAPALFRVECGDRSCKEGGYDITTEVLEALFRGDSRFTGHAACNGSIGSMESLCHGVLEYVAEATYA